MLDRLLGLETEYAIRYSASDGQRPGNDVIYGAIADGVRRLVTTHPGERGGEAGRAQIFVQNGGALYYEVLPHALKGGLLEASTPECKTPSQLLLYQKAEEDLLLLALPLAEDRLRLSGFDGEIGLIKNCRDGEDHVYGAQENYEVEVARGLPLFLYRAGILLLFPLIPFEFLLFWIGAGLVIAAIIGLCVAASIIGALVPSLRERLSFFGSLADDDTVVSRQIGLATLWIECALYWPLLAPFTLLLRLFAFRRIRREMIAFIVSRPILTGTGTVDREGRYGLSEKGPAMRRPIRTFVDPDNRPIFDTGNLMKDLMAILYLRARALRRLFGRRQRLQLGLSDSNAAQVAEYLKIGTTTLVIDMIESGFLGRAPRPRDVVGALHAICADPTLKVKVAVRGGEAREMSALELQRWYLARAREYVESSGVASMEAREIVRLWGEALDALEVNPESLVGRLDWVTKRYLLETAGADLPAAGRKKIDLRYHELGKGYLAEMERRGAAMTLVEPDEVRRAVQSPPEETPARVRGRLIRELAGSKDRITVSWDSVRIGGRVGGQVIRLSDYLR